MTDEWRERLHWSAIAAAIVAGCWLIALAVSGDPPAAYDAPRTTTRYSVTPGYSYKPTVYPISTAAPIERPKPVRWVWRRYEHPWCAKELWLTHLCELPTPSPYYPSDYIGR